MDSGSGQSNPQPPISSLFPASFRYNPTMRNVLLIGPEELTPLTEALHGEGFHAVLRLPGDGSTPEEGAYDAVVLDIAAMGEDPLIKRFLESAHTGEGPPVIALVDREQLATSDPWQQTDDFMLKGSPPDELVGRIRQALWKRHRVDTRNTLKCGDLLMDLSNYTVYISGRHIGLTFKEYELLRFLATNPDRVFTRETLLNKVWGYDFYGGARTVDVHIRRLRSKIEERGHSFVETVRNVGYRFRASGG